MLLTIFSSQPGLFNNKPFFKVVLRTQTRPLLLLLWDPEKWHLVHLWFPQCFDIGCCIHQDSIACYMPPRLAVWGELPSRSVLHWADWTYNLFQPGHLARDGKTQYLHQANHSNFQHYTVRQKPQKWPQNETMGLHNTISPLSHEIQVLHMVSSVTD